MSFLGFFLAEPRGAVRFALGAAFLRAARLIAFRSSVLSILVVFAMVFSLRQNLLGCYGFTTKNTQT